MNPQDIPALDPETPVILEMSHISKTFGAVTALVDVSIKLRQGEVLALIGDNGAGKSTLIKILSGFHQPDAGTIVSRGQEVHFGSPRDARAQSTTECVNCSPNGKRFSAQPRAVPRRRRASRRWLPKPPAKSRRSADGCAGWAPISHRGRSGAVRRRARRADA